MINVIFNGRLGADAEIRQRRDGSQFIAFNVAVNEYRGKNEKQTSWMRVTSNNVNMAQHLKKGSFVTISGVETINTFTNKNGETQFSRDVNADRIGFVDVAKTNNESSDTSQSVVVQTTSSVSQPSIENGMACGTFQPQVAPSFASMGPSGDEDDLPF